MTRRSRWLAVGSAIGVGGAGAYVAFVLAGGRWAAAGAVIGAVTGSFAPSIYDALVGRGDKREALRATIERPVPQSPARLLDPRRELVDFVGREDELKALQAWCTDKQAARLRLVTGPGGVGKTRLSVELADRMRKAGWTTERVADGQVAHAIPALADGYRRRALLIVDYAETRAGLNQMLSDLAGERSDGVRVLLLARSAGDWWDRLGVENPAAWDQVQAAKQAVIDLAPAVSADLSDAEIAARAARAFAAELGLPEVTVGLGGNTGRRRALDLHAAGLIAVLNQASRAPGTVDVGDVFDELLRHEQHLWYDGASAAGLIGGHAGLTQRQIRQLIAAACLLGASTEGEARALAARVPALAPSAVIADWLHELYPPDVGETEWIGSLQPDRLAELHAIHELTASPELAESCLTSLDPRQALRAVTVLARVSSDYPRAEELLRQVLPDVDDKIAGMPASIDELTVIYSVIPRSTVILAPAAVSLCKRILGLLPADADPGLRALWLSNFDVRLSELGRPADALPHSKDAVAIYRKLGTSQPDRYRPGLARSLHNLAVRLSELGRPADALPPAEEAVALYRALAIAQPDQYRPDLARSLDQLGIYHWELGHPADALPVAEEAVALYRVSPDRYRPGLAGLLDNLGIWYRAMGRPADALPPAEESVAIRRELAAAEPDQYRPDLARSLNNLGVRFSELGRPADALPPAEESVAIRRELAAALPGRYRPDLASSLNNLGAWLSELGRPADALPPAKEAVALYRELAATLPGRHRPDLTESLTNLGVTYSALGHPADALPPTEEAAAIRRDLAAASPDRYRPDLAASLRRLTAIHNELGHPADAESLRAEAEQISDADAGT